MSIDLRMMRYVVAVAEEGGFQNAAVRLNIAQSALSRQVRQLEGELGVELFRRRPTRLTETGQAFVDDARRILDEVDRALERTRLVGRGEVGRVRIGHTIASSFDALPRLLDRIYSDHPGIEVETGRRWDGELPAALEGGDFDLAIGHQLIGRPGTASALLRREPLAAVLPAQHPLAASGGVALRDLRGETLRVMPRRLAPAYYDLVVGALHSAGEAFDVWESADPRLGSYAVDDLGGFTVAPASVANRLPCTVTCVPFTDTLPTVGLTILWRPDAASPARVVAGAARQLAVGPEPTSRWA